MILSDTFVSLVRHYREYAANCLAKRSAMGMGNVGFGAGSASSEPVLALFPRLAADPALMMVRAHAIHATRLEQFFPACIQARCNSLWLFLVVL